MVKNERWLANDKAGKQLFPMYRNPSMDDREREGPEPQHGEHAHHQPQGIPAVVEGGQPPERDGLC